MRKKFLIKNFIKIGIKTWLKFNCKEIKIEILKIKINNKFLGKIDKLYFEAQNLIYENLYLKKIIIKSYDFNLKFNYKNHLLYSDDLVICCLLKIDSNNLKNIFFSSKWKNVRNNIERELLESNKVSNLVINNELISLNYQENNHNLKRSIALKLKENLLFLNDIKKNKKMLIPLDRNIKIKNCQIKKGLINLEFSSKVIFDN